MFEKEAEERARKLEAKQTLGIYDNEEDYARDSGWNDGEVAGYEEGFKDGAEFGYNKCKEEMQKNGLALQLDMDRTIEQNFALKDELNKAVEIIEGLLDFDFLPDVDIKKQAEEFLSEVVKW